MSCAISAATFRLLDAFVGWDSDGTLKGIEGLEDPNGLRLEALTTGAVAPSDIWPYIPPPRLARGCDCRWYLVTPYPPQSRLLFRDPCHPEWTSVWPKHCMPVALVDPVAVAARRHRLAIADKGADTVWVFASSGERVVAAISIKKPVAVAFTPWGELLVAQEGSPRIHRYSPTGEPRGALVAEASAPIERIAVDRHCNIWIVTRDEDGTLRLWRTRRLVEHPHESHGHPHESHGCDGEDQILWDPTGIAATFEPGDPADLPHAFEPTQIVNVAEEGFCFEERDAGGIPQTVCFSWYGRPLPASALPQLQPPPRAKLGQLLTTALDSGIPRCRWHRVRVEAETPPGTTVTVTIATSESREPPDHLLAIPAASKWTGFAAGAPHPDDWQASTAGATDFLIEQPPGRYLFLRIRLTGDGTSTPVVRRIRIDFPRETSLNFLPAVYREDPEAEDFTERFLSIFDASIEDLDRAIERFPALLDTDGVPEEVLPWLAQFLAVALDPSWEPARIRDLLKEMPELFRRRGTPEGIKQALGLVFGIHAEIEEMTSDVFGALGHSAQLRSVRLFARAKARFYVGRSALGLAPLRRHGDPDQDPHLGSAFRFAVSVPPGENGTDSAEVRRLVATQKPAHTIASVRQGGAGFLVGIWSGVGIDSIFGPLSAPVLGARGNVRLGRMSVLWSGPRGRRTGITLGETVAVGIHTVME